MILTDPVPPARLAAVAKWMIDQADLPNAGPVTADFVTRFGVKLHVLAQTLPPELRSDVLVIANAMFIAGEAMWAHNAAVIVTFGQLLTPKET